MGANFTILCPIDFSECALNALEYAAKIGEKYKAKLIVFHVLNRQDYQNLFPLDLDGIFQKEFVEKKLKSLQEAVLKESLPKGLKSCEVVIFEGSIVQTTISYSQKINANLIVVGTEGINEFRKQVFGSRSCKMVLQTDRDILVVPRKAFFKRPRKLVYASDYVDEDKSAIKKVVAFAKFFDSEIDIVHISLRSRLIDKALHKTMVEEIKPAISYKFVNYVLKAFREDVALGIENYLQLAKGDILVTVSKKKDFFDQLFTKNLSRKMSYFITKPLWVIKSF